MSANEKLINRIKFNEIAIKEDINIEKELEHILASKIVEESNKISTSKTEIISKKIN